MGGFSGMSAVFTICAGRFLGWVWRKVPVCGAFQRGLAVSDRFARRANGLPSLVDRFARRASRLSSVADRFARRAFGVELAAALSGGLAKGGAGR